MTKHEEGVRDLQQMEDILYKIEKGDTSKPIILAIARAVWFLLERWVREH